MAGMLKMTTSELTTAKAKIANDNVVLGDCIQNIYNEILNLTSTSWQGEAAKEAKDQIESFYKKTFQSYKDAVDGYISFIDETVKRYDQTEDALKSNAKTSMDNSALADFA